MYGSRPGSQPFSQIGSSTDRAPSRRAPRTHTGRSPVAAVPQALASGTTLCLAASLSSIGDPLGVPRRELLRHGASRLHTNLAQAIMRWPTRTSTPPWQSKLAESHGTGDVRDPYPFAMRVDRKSVV